MEPISVDDNNFSGGMPVRNFFSGSKDPYHGWPGRKPFRKPAIRDTERPLERRGQPRYQIQRDTFAFIRDRRFPPIHIRGVGMGKIAAAVFKCHPACLGRVADASMDGLALRHVGNLELDPAGEYALDILIVDCGLYLANLSFRVVSDTETAEDFLAEPLTIRLLRVQFESLSPAQFSELDDFLQNCSVT